MSEALALIELSSIARGYQVADAVVKKAPVMLRDCRPVSPGKFLVLFDGDVASVDEAFRRGVEVAGDRLVDKLFLPQAHPLLGPAVRGESNAGAGVESYAVVETLSVAAALLAADAAAKAAAVRLVEMQLGRGIGGKAFFALSGPLADIEAAVDAAISITDRALLLGTEIIPAPHEDFVAKLP
ncbi:MAG TPA: BMC domain-containing protein [Polyangia bacterium]|jgi:microcompartment protein CcmL/EutN|nr:BMC domain-containing protein [Polyangia bacterium]